MTNGFDDMNTAVAADRDPVADPGRGHLLTESEVAEHQLARGDVPGIPSWPIISPTTLTEALPPPVGMNWTLVSERTGVDVRILEHDGSIVLAGEYVPAPGFVIDTVTFLARSAHIGDRVLYHSYFIGELTASEYGLKLSLDPDSGSVPNAVVRTASAPVIGLFTYMADADRARRQVMEGSVGYGLYVQEGPLGTELRIARTENAGRAATVIACHHGAVISVGGEAL
jgi:hypothetical protein